MATEAPARLDLLAPLSGLMVNLADVPDPAFSGKLVGDGISIDPTSSELLAPAAGEVTQLHGAGHAVAIRTAGGIEVLLHIGLDTVALKGEGFTAKVALGDRVEAGQVLIVFDPLLVGGKARSLLTQMILPDGARITALRPAQGLVAAGKDIALSLDVAGAGAAAQAPQGTAVLSRAVALPNASGLHARPAAVLAAAARAFTAPVFLVRGTEEVDATSVLAILGLATQAGDSLQVKASGPDARGATETLATLLEGGCGEAAGTPAAAGPVAAPSVAGALCGVPASPGVAIGQVFQFRPEAQEVVEAGQDPARERTRLEAALREGGLQLAALRTRTAAGTAGGGILSAHQELLADPGLTVPALAAIAAGKSAGFAWRAACDQAAAKLAALAQPLLKERATDIRDVGRRILALLAGPAPARPEAPPDSILIAEELTPSEAVQLDPARILGLCTTTGGPTGHVAILARALGIPAVCGMDRAALDLPGRTQVVLDGGTGVLNLEPGPADLERARKRVERQAAQRALEQEAALKPALTADGASLEVAANIRNAREAVEAVAAGAQGVGLLRSEFLFLDRATAPTEEEQAAEYGKVARTLGPGRRCVIRTLDVGGDKPLPYLPLPDEANPFLGLRGVRVSLERPELFRTQLRAILRAAPLGDVHVMFPMIATLEELHAAKALLGEEADALGRTVKVGLMIEVPSAVLIADALAREVDFFSIGTNDLTQYCLAMDRGHPRLARQADALHPAVLRLIALTVEAAHRHGKWVGVCGGLASDLLALPALLGLGVDELSVDVPSIGAVKCRLSRLARTECEALARELLTLPTAMEVRARLASMAD